LPLSSLGMGKELFHDCLANSNTSWVLVRLTRLKPALLADTCLQRHNGPQVPSNQRICEWSTDLIAHPEQYLKKRDSDSTGRLGLEESYTRAVQFVIATPSTSTRDITASVSFFASTNTYGSQEILIPG
jgi:hypothetical protein